MSGDYHRRMVFLKGLTLQWPVIDRGRYVVGSIFAYFMLGTIADIFNKFNAGATTAIAIYATSESPCGR